MCLSKAHNIWPRQIDFLCGSHAVFRVLCRSVQVKGFQAAYPASYPYLRPWVPGVHTAFLSVRDRVPSGRCVHESRTDQLWLGPKHGWEVACVQMLVQVDRTNEAIVNWNLYPSFGFSLRNITDAGYCSLGPLDLDLIRDQIVPREHGHYHSYSAGLLQTCEARGR